MATPDPLDEIAALLKVEALLSKRIEGSGLWSLAISGHAGVDFATVLSGTCELRMVDRAYRLRKGDYVLLTGPSSYCLSTGKADTVDGDLAFARSPSGLVQLGVDAQKTETILVGGHLELDSTNEGFLLDVLPGVIHVKEEAARSIGLKNLVTLLREEMRETFAGRDLLLNRLAQVMLLRALRSPAVQAAIDRPGWLHALSDPAISKALRALHSGVRERWTLDMLARHVGVSRSVFALRFKKTVGIAPMEYLLRWKMALAKDALRNGKKKISVVANDTGYASESAFSAAFRRTVGCSPARYARASSNLS